MIHDHGRTDYRFNSVHEKVGDYSWLIYTYIYIAPYENINENWIVATSLRCTFIYVYISPNTRKFVKRQITAEFIVTLRLTNKSSVLDNHDPKIKFTNTIVSVFYFVRLIII